MSHSKSRDSETPPTREQNTKLSHNVNKSIENGIICFIRSVFGLSIPLVYGIINIETEITNTHIIKYLVYREIYFQSFRGEYLL